VDSGPISSKRKARWKECMSGLRSTNRKADRELIAELNRSCSGISYDEMPMPELSLDALFLDLKPFNKIHILSILN
jgi:predicted HTH transcriptional regulator